MNCKKISALLLVLVLALCACLVSCKQEQWCDVTMVFSDDVQTTTRCPVGESLTLPEGYSVTGNEQYVGWYVSPVSYSSIDNYESLCRKYQRVGGRILTGSFSPEGGSMTLVQIYKYKVNYSYDGKTSSEYLLCGASLKDLGTKTVDGNTRKVGWTDSDGNYYTTMPLNNGFGGLLLTAKWICYYSHDYTWTVTKEATCTEAGSKKGVCNICGYSEVTRIPSGHDFTWTVTKEATCTENGSKEGACSRCGHTVTDVIYAKGHILSDWVTVKEPTESELGEKYRTCSGCSLKTTIYPPLADQMIDLSEYGCKLEISNTELTYGKWYKVYQWATSPERGEKIYSFDNPGMEGNDGTKGAAPTSAKDEPVTKVSWRDAIVWCNALSEMEGLTPVYYTDADYKTPLRTSTTSETVTYNVKGSQDCPYIYAAISGNIDISNCTSTGYRLPTIAERTTAAKAGTSYKYAGSDNINEVAWYSDNAGYSSPDYGTRQVGTKKANSWGLYDMSGNVWEWCWELISSGRCRIMRGGSWYNNANRCEVSCVYYDGYYPYFVYDYVGFRVCRSVL